MTAVRRWSGREARALRLALRLSVRSFAEQLGVATRTVSKWESGGAATVPRPDTQAILDTALARTDAAARERFALLCLPDERPTGSERGRLPVRSAEHVDEILVHLQEQWHALVRTDNLLGPRFALPAVLDHIAITEELLRVTSGEHRRALVTLAATYAESAAWLHEDAGQMPAAEHWVGRAIWRAVNPSTTSRRTSDSRSVSRRGPSHSAPGRPNSSRATGFAPRRRSMGVDAAAEAESGTSGRHRDWRAFASRW